MRALSNRSVIAALAIVVATLSGSSASAGGRSRGTTAIRPADATLLTTVATGTASRAVAFRGRRTVPAPTSLLMTCEPLDVIEVIDKSGSMSGGRIVHARYFAQVLLSLLDPVVDRAGLVAFNHLPELLQPLTTDLDLVASTVLGITSGGGTDIATGINQAQAELAAATGRPILVLFTDGLSAEVPLLAAAANAKMAGTEIFVIAYDIAGYPLAIDVLSEAVTSPDHLFLITAADDLRPILDLLHRRVCVCGDGVLDPGELCDDGNTVPGDGCTACRPDPTCGNGTIEPWENCDDGSQCENGDPCDPLAPPPSVCTGIGDEQCRPRNDPICDENCIFNVPFCGNGILEPGEECDDGNTMPGDGCTPNCRLDLCGNGVLDPGEQCDDGNRDDGDGCSSSCRAECVDSDGGIVMPVAGTVTSGGSSYSDTCTGTMLEEWFCGPMCNTQRPLPTEPQLLVVDCLANGYTGCVAGACTPDDGRRDAPQCNWLCGNGVLDPGEICDDGNTVNDDGCNNLCQPPHICGDGIVQVPEQCDDGNNTDGDGCNAWCTLERCGDGILQAWELCDDGNNLDGDGCSAECIPEGTCGDGIPEPGEACDDGNTDPTDQCDEFCEPTYCGDAILQAPNGWGIGGPLDDGFEACDDGNRSSADQCNQDCTPTVCGDGILQNPNGTGTGGPLDDGVEVCDDANTDPADLCHDCALTVCGDGVVQSPNGTGTGGPLNDGVEECDDGNMIPGDDCTDCTWDVILAVTWDQLDATCGELGAVVSWSVLQEEGTIGYQVRRGASAEGPFVAVPGFVSATGGPSSYQLLDVTAQRQERFYVVVEYCTDWPQCSVSPAFERQGSCGQGRP